MATYGGLNIITDGLVLYLDAANQRSLDTRNILYNTDTLTGWATAPYEANIVVTPNAAIAVDGKPTASKIKFNESATVRCLFRNAIVSLNDTNTFSVYVKSVSGSSTITLDIGDQGVRSFTVNDTEWTRCYTTHTRTSQYGSTTNFVDISATAGTEVYVCNAQLNFGELIDYIAVGNESIPFKNLIKPSENAVLTNGPIFYLENNGIIRFDGSNDYCDVTSNKFSSSVNTVELFFRWRTNLNDMPIGFTGYNIWTADAAFGFNTFASDVYGISPQRVIDLNLRGTSNINWHHYVIVFSNQIKNSKIYIDGNQEVLSQIRGTTNLETVRSFSSTVRIAGVTNVNDYFMNGDYSFVKIYNRELTQEEILQNYNATKGRFGL